MDVVYRCVAGLDVHKRSVAVCVRCIHPEGAVKEEVRTFGTMTRNLLQLAEWMESHGVTHVAMESTGVYWKPIWNLLEDRFELMLVNAHELKQVPGRKSDIRDCQWIAQLLQCGLLHSSFVPSREQREVRDLTRLRCQLEGERNRVANRIQKVLEDANLKLASVASDTLGKSGREILAALVREETDATELADLAKGRLRGKIPQLELALEGRVTEHHRFLLKHLLEHLDQLEQQIAQLDERIGEKTRPFLTDGDVQRLDEIPGINLRTIENVVAEIGTNMEQFPTDGHLSSWAGLCPGNEVSAGKRKRSRTTKGNQWLRRALTPAAWSASRAKGSYFQAQYARLAGRRGKKRAAIGVAHSLLVVIYHLLKHPDRRFADLGADYFLQLQPERNRRYLVQQLERLGYEVTLTPIDRAA
jgi:transposase